MCVCVSVPVCVCACGCVFYVTFREIWQSMSCHPRPSLQENCCLVSYCDCNNVSRYHGHPDTYDVMTDALIQDSGPVHAAPPYVKTPKSRDASRTAEGEQTREVNKACTIAARRRHCLMPLLPLPHTFLERTGLVNNLRTRRSINWLTTVVPVDETEQRALVLCLT